MGIATAALPNSPSDGEKGGLQGAGSGALQDTGTAARFPAQQIACPNYIPNSQKRAVKLKKDMNSIPIELSSFNHSYTSELRSIRIHSCIHI